MSQGIKEIIFGEEFDQEEEEGSSATTMYTAAALFGVAVLGVGVALFNKRK